MCQCHVNDNDINGDRMEVVIDKNSVSRVVARCVRLSALFSQCKIDTTSNDDLCLTSVKSLGTRL